MIYPVDSPIQLFEQLGPDYKLTSSYFSSNRNNNRNLSTSNVEESVQMIKSEVIPCLQNAMETLQNIWSEIGLQEDQKEERTKSVLYHLRNLLQEMVNEEEELKSTLQANVETCTKELEMLSGELGLPVFKVCKPFFTSLPVHGEKASIQYCISSTQRKKSCFKDAYMYNVSLY